MPAEHGLRFDDHHGIHSDGNSRHNQTRISRSMSRNLARFCDFRLSTSSCWRITRISASREARTTNSECTASRIRISNAVIARCSRTLAELRHADKILTNHRTRTRQAPGPSPARCSAKNRSQTQYRRERDARVRQGKQIWIFSEVHTLRKSTQRAYRI